MNNPSVSSKSAGHPSRWDSKERHIVHGICSETVDSDTSDQVAYENSLKRTRRSIFKKSDGVSSGEHLLKNRFDDFRDIFANCYIEGGLLVIPCLTKADCEALEFGFKFREFIRETPAGVREYRVFVELREAIARGYVSVEIDERCRREDCPICGCMLESCDSQLILSAESAELIERLLRPGKN